MSRCRIHPAGPAVLGSWHVRLRHAACLSPWQHDVGMVITEGCKQIQIPSKQIQLTFSDKGAGGTMVISWRIVGFRAVAAAPPWLGSVSLSGASCGPQQGDGPQALDGCLD